MALYLNVEALGLLAELTVLSATGRTVSIAVALGGAGRTPAGRRCDGRVWHEAQDHYRICLAPWLCTKHSELLPYVFFHEVGHIAADHCAPASGATRVYAKATAARYHANELEADAWAYELLRKWSQTHGGPFNAVALTWRD